MNRYFPMSPIATAALWANTTGGASVPTQWLIEGNFKEGYKVFSLDDEKCGLPVLETRTLFQAKDFVKQINESGKDTHWERYCLPFTFTWRGKEINLPNGYKLSYNPLFKEFRVSHEVVGGFEFKDIKDALEYADKG